MPRAVFFNIQRSGEKASITVQQRTVGGSTFLSLELGWAQIYFWLGSECPKIILKKVILKYYIFIFASSARCRVDEIAYLPKLKICFLQSGKQIDPLVPPGYNVDA